MEKFLHLHRLSVGYPTRKVLENIELEIEKGEILTLIGPNGAGKSTLLKTIAGVLKPTKGSVKTSGVIAPMLELGAGFDMNYSGKENIFLYGATMGYSRKFIEEKYEAGIVLEGNEVKSLLQNAHTSFTDCDFRLLVKVFISKLMREIVSHQFLDTVLEHIADNKDYK